MSDPAERVAELRRLTAEWRGCTACALAQTRTQVVVGDGDPQADLMFVGEAPGFHEDRQGVPFVGQAGGVLDGLLEQIGLDRRSVYIANVLKCRPPGNRDPDPDEIAACEGHLFAQVELIQPVVICTLGNFATRLLSGQPAGITRVHGRPQRRRIGSRELVLYPIFHPAAALYTPTMMQALREDFGRLPELLSARPEPAPAPELPASPPQQPRYAQLGLF
ncbi:MAG TPA: uracil-DNA glycosylase [Gaiellales bacterium]|nr:uracil-DNA glycosylase [Gaiellales bacterium]